MASNERAPSLTYSETSTESQLSDIDDDKGTFELKFKLLMAERRNIDLELKMTGVESENRAFKDQVRQSQAARAATATVTDTAELQAEHERLTKAIEEKELELSMRNLSLEHADKAEHEAIRTRAHMNAMQDKNDKLTDELDRLQLELNEAKAQTQETNGTRAFVDGLHATIAALRDKNEQLSDKNSQLATKSFTSQEVVKKNIDDMNRLQAENENSKHEVRDLRMKLTAAETDRDWHRKEHSQILEVRNALNAERNQDGSQINRLKGEKSKVKKENKDLEKQISELKFNIGYYITDLDLAERGFRVFTCRHNHINDIPDGNNTTREKRCGLVAAEIFQNWQTDEDFMREYNYARRAYLEHHRAHERVRQGRGDDSKELKHELIQVDMKRGVIITYE